MTYVAVRATPGARKETIEKSGAQEFVISVREPAERNLANQRIREMVAAEYGVPVGCVRLVAGHRSPKKVFDVQLLT